MWAGSDKEALPAFAAFAYSMRTDIPQCSLISKYFVTPVQADSFGATNMT
jgi:hypothetical protein